MEVTAQLLLAVQSIAGFSLTMTFNAAINNVNSVYEILS